MRYTDAILGGSAAVATIRGEARLPIPPGTQNGQVLTLPGAGISPGAAAIGADAGQPGQPRQLAAGSGQRGAHHYTVVLLLPSQARFHPFFWVRAVSFGMPEIEWLCRFVRTMAGCAWWAADKSR